MAEKPDKTKTPAAEDTSQQANLSDYLQAPRRKRKNYIIMAFGQNFSRELAADIETFAKKTFTNLAVSTPSSLNELTRQFGRNIALLIINDEFDTLDNVIASVKSMKEKRHDEQIPVLFLTRSTNDLIKKYHEELLPYHETDDFIQYPGTPNQKIYAIIKNGVDFRNARKSRRYKVELPMKFFHLSKNQDYTAEILDLSIHGALVSTKNTASDESGQLFDIGDQLLLKIPVTNYLDITDGDFIKVSGVVKRVYISGTRAAIAFQHVSETRLKQLTEVIAKIVMVQLERKYLKARADHPVKGHE